MLTELFGVCDQRGAGEERLGAAADLSVYRPLVARRVINKMVVFFFN